ncbi:MAG: small subunit ribosomal protein [Clostridiales bacterium]|jgi:small subunit ribosomal protein S20|nr:small subunit ribosomal protein [Clostridiales bacterium]MDN5299834.1 small subunit ribosomal protein [Clostridiales bacterium]
MKKNLINAIYHDKISLLKIYRGGESQLANIKSAKKRINVINKKTAVNKSRKSAIKTAEKRFLEALAAGDVQTATQRMVFFEKKMAQAAAKGTYHANAASRKISRLKKKLNAAAE